MTKEDFEIIIFESFDHLPSLQAYFEGKRNIFARTRGDFSSGLRSAFDGLNSEANMTDYDRTVYILNGEAIEEIPNDRKQMEFLRNKPRLITHPYKKAIDLLQRTNGRIIGILTKERLESLWPVLEVYLKFLEKIPELTDCTPEQNQEKSEQHEAYIDKILNGMFQLNEVQLATLKQNLIGMDSYIGLTYVGTKTSLEKQLKQLRMAGVDRKEIARVFEKKVRWCKTSHSIALNLDYNTIYKKI